MMRFLIFILIMVSITTKVATAQEKLWTLRECMEYAVSNSPRTNIQKMENQKYKQDYKSAIGALLPKLNAETSAGFNFGRGVDSETNTYIDLNSFNNDYNLHATLTLFNGLANYNQVRMSKVNRIRGRQQLQQEQDVVAYQTMECFVNLLYNSDLVDIATEQLKESDQRLKQSERMVELGLKGEPDLAEIRAQWAEDRYKLTRQQNQRTIAVILLKEKMNLPVEQELAIVREGFTQDVYKVEESALSIYNRSKQFNPKTLVAEAQLHAEQLNHKVAKGALMPSMSVSAGIGTIFSKYMDGSDYSSFSKQFKDKRGEFVTFRLSVPIFNGFASSARMKQARANAYIAEYRREETYRELYSEIEQAVADLNGQIDEYAQAVNQCEAAGVAHRVNERKYEQGLIDPIILHTSSNRLQQAQAEKLNTRYKCHLKERLVGYYKGEPFISYVN